MDRDDVNLIRTYEPVDDAVRWMDNLANQGAFEFWNGPTRLRKDSQPVGRSNQLGNDN